MSKAVETGNEVMSRNVKPEIKNVYVRRRRKNGPQQQETENQQATSEISRQDDKPHESTGYNASTGRMGLDASMPHFVANLSNTQLLQYVELSTASVSSKHNPVMDFNQQTPH